MMIDDTGRLVNTWNSLSSSVITANTIDSFKNRLDELWSNQDILYTYKVELTGGSDKIHFRHIMYCRKYSCMLFIISTA